ncbi:hypothetical protein [Gemmatimonas sp.]
MTEEVSQGLALEKPRVLSIAPELGAKAVMASGVGPAPRDRR